MKNELKYRPRPVETKLFAKYDALWNCDHLRDPKAISRMKMASRQGRPAVTALDIDCEDVWRILESAAENGELNEVKKMIGSMVKQIMEAEGYVPSTGGNRATPSSWIFTSGTLFRHPNWRNFYVHRSKDQTSGREFCISRKRYLSSLQYFDNHDHKCGDWVYHRKCRSRHELIFVLGGTLREFVGGNRNEPMNWNKLSKEVCANGCVHLKPTKLFKPHQTEE